MRSRPTVTRPELVQLVSRRTSIPAHIVSAVFRGLGDELVHQMSAGRPVQVQGVAKMSRVWRPGRTVTDVSSGKSRPVPPRWVAKLAPGSRLKDAAANPATVDETADAPSD